MDERKTERVFIRDLYVICSLRMQHFDRGTVAMSDCCRRNAETGVQHPDGSVLWRCRTHEGMLDFRTGERAPVVLTVLQYVD